MKSLKVILLSFMLVFMAGPVVTAEEVVPVEVTEEIEEAVAKAVNIDEDIQPEDLGISEPKILPDSPFYFLKNWARSIQGFFTFNPIKKAELRLKFANEKLMEVKKIVETRKDPEIIKKATENYQKEVEEVKNRAKDIKEKARENPKVESFLDKFIHQQTLHQKLLDRLGTQVPPEVFEKIKEARERHLERFQEVMLKLEDRPETITEKLDKILQEQKGSQFKEFKNLEVLRNLEEKVPEEAKEAIKKAKENTLKRLQEDLEKMSLEDQEKFKEYIEKIFSEKKDLIKPEVCPTLWDPVCGKDEKTYPNACLAKLAEVEISYKGICKEEKKENEEKLEMPREKNMTIECRSDIDCRDLICPQVIGQDTPRCDLETKTCYCGTREEKW